MTELKLPYMTQKNLPSASIIKEWEDMFDVDPVVTAAIHIVAEAHRRGPCAEDIRDNPAQVHIDAVINACQALFKSGIVQRPDDGEQDREVFKWRGFQITVPHTFTWTVEIEVSAIWIQDGFDLDDDRATEMVRQDLQFAHEHEVKVRVIDAPNPLTIRREQGYLTVEEYQAAMRAHEAAGPTAEDIANAPGDGEGGEPKPTIADLHANLGTLKAAFGPGGEGDPREVDQSSKTDGGLFNQVD